jgi:hypothetical protein
LVHYAKRFVATEGAKPPNFKPRKSTGKSVNRIEGECDETLQDRKAKKVSADNSKRCQREECKGLDHTEANHEKIVKRMEKRKANEQGGTDKRKCTRAGCKGAHAEKNNDKIMRSREIDEIRRKHEEDANQHPQ